MFLHDTLPIGSDRQSPDDYVEQVSATTGMPYALVRRAMTRVAGVMARLDEVLCGLTRGLEPGVLDRGFGEIGGQAVSFYPKTGALGVVLPSNSPGVHGLWAPAIALKTPLVLKPGGAEPWTPYRMVQALIKAGVPRDAFCFFPSGHPGAGEIVRQTGRSMFFGDALTVGALRAIRASSCTDRVSASRVRLDTASRWRDSLDLLVTSVSENGGRSCVNASGVWTPSHGADVVAGLAERLAAIAPRADDPLAALAPFADLAVARRIADQIDAGLMEPGPRTSRRTSQDRRLSRSTAGGACCPR
jgi:acyl-CoA reductase-like NAD-dependent aldehyde dehydrogenase